MSERSSAVCHVCGLETEYPHTPLDHPMRVHRLVREARIAEAVAAERARITAAVETMPTARVISQWDLVSRKAVLAIVTRPSSGAK